MVNVFEMINRKKWQIELTSNTNGGMCYWHRLVDIYFEFENGSEMKTNDS